jgi:nitrate/TMAO reductase-like tetraheme cytochrome c subunit
MTKHSQSTDQPKSKRPLLFKIAIILGGLLILGTAGGVTAMTLENHDSFCASCHAEPEYTYFQRESAAPTDLATFHTTKQTTCIDCHSGNGIVPGRINSMMLGARDLVSWIGGHAPQPAPLNTPIGDENCLKCHGTIAAAQNMNNHFHVFLSQWQAKDPTAATCVSCHQGHNNSTADSTLAFLDRQATTAVCQSCHTFSGQGN